MGQVCCTHLADEKCTPYLVGKLERKYYVSDPDDMRI